MLSHLCERLRRGLAAALKGFRKWPCRALILHFDTCDAPRYSKSLSQAHVRHHLSLFILPPLVLQSRLPNRRADVSPDLSAAAWHNNVLFDSETSIHLCCSQASPTSEEAPLPSTTGCTRQTWNPLTGLLAVSEQAGSRAWAAWPVQASGQLQHQHQHQHQQLRLQQGWQGRLESYSRAGL